MSNLPRNYVMGPNDWACPEPPAPPSHGRHAAEQLLGELESWARSHGALQAGRGNVDDVIGFIEWCRAARRHADG